MSETVLGMVEQVARAHGDALALVEPVPDAAGVATTLSYDELVARAHGLRGDLAARGITAGDVVGLWLPNWHELVVWELAVTSLGATVLGINTRYHVHELAHLLRRTRPRCVALPGAFLELDFVGRLASALTEAADAHADVAPPSVAVVRPPDDAPPSAEFDVGGGAWAPRGPTSAASAGPRGEPATLAHLFTTSGSTGAPKLAGHDQASVVRHSGHVARRLDLRPGDAVLAALPLTGVFGFTPAFAALGQGAACVLEPVFRPEAAVADMARLAVTHVVGADDLLGRIKDAWTRQPADLSAWRVGGIADFVARTGEIAEWAETEFGARIAGVYGSSELFALTAMWPLDMARSDRVVAGGQVVASEIAWRVADPETDRPLPAEQVGELQFRGYNVMRGYYGDADATAAAFTADGWMRSGDLGSARSDGSGLVYLCRAGDELRLRGFLVDPAEIEHALAAHPGVAVAKVVGVDRPGEGDVAIAFVTRSPSAAAGDEDEFILWCRRRLARFKVPERVVVLDEFPVTVGVNGTKIRAGELRARARELVADRGPSRADRS